MLQRVKCTSRSCNLFSIQASRVSIFNFQQWKQNSSSFHIKLESIAEFHFQYRCCKFSQISQGKTEPWLPWFHSGCTCNPCITFLAKSLPAPFPAFLSGCHRNNKRRLTNWRSSLDKPWSCFTSMVTKAEIASWKKTVLAWNFL